MLFTRSLPGRRYRNYAAYRSLLRKDFRYRCAYCLTQEAYLGSDANFAIDHHRPQHGNDARPDLSNEYTNLYWTCRECHENKADIWPTLQQEAQGIRWLDPCEPWGDHDLHWQISADGEIQWLTAIGEYTVKKLMLDRRDWLKRHWRRMQQWQHRRVILLQTLESREVSPELRAILEQQIAELNELLNPPVFNIPRRARQA